MPTDASPSWRHLARLGAFLTRRLAVQTFMRGPRPPLRIRSAPIVDEQGNEIVHSWALAPAGTDEASGVGNRPDLSYVADPGAVIEDAVTLYNLSNVPLTFKIYATDAFNDDDGQFGLLDSDETPVDVGTWIDLGGEEVPVPARTQVTIPITLTIPENATPGDHVGAVLAANAALTTGDEGQALTLDRRTGTRLYVRVNGPLVPNLRSPMSAPTTGLAESAVGFGPGQLSSREPWQCPPRRNRQASVGGPFGLGEQKGTETELAELLPGLEHHPRAGIRRRPGVRCGRHQIELDPGRRRWRSWRRRPGVR